MRCGHSGFSIILEKFDLIIEFPYARFLFAFASIWSLGYSATYVPGEKGAPWTLEEAMVVKAKLLSSMDLDGTWGNMWQVYRDVQGQHGFGGEDMPAESKVCANFAFLYKSNSALAWLN